MKQYPKKTSMTENLHFSMFAPNAQIAKDNASHAFGKQLGSPIGNVPRITYNKGAKINDLAANVAPGVLSIGTTLTIGSTADGFNAPINKACRSLYAKYWAKNSSISKFQEMDIGLYTFASAQIVAIYSWLCTVYAATFMNDVTNKYTRSGVLAALGVSPSDITTHTTDLRGFINQLTIDMAGFNFDKSIPLYKYASQMYSTLLKDEANYSKTQYYVTVPANVLTYVKSGENIGSLRVDKFVEIFDSVPHLLTYNEIVTKVTAVLSAFISSYYISDISTAIGKAIESNTFVLGTVDENYRLEFKYDEIALTRIKNAIICDPVFSDITQDVVNRKLAQDVTANITADTPNKAATVCALSEPPVVHAISPATATPENVIVLASFVNGWDTPANLDYGGTSHLCTMKYYGFEVTTHMAVITFTKDGDLGVMSASSAVGITFDGTSVTNVENIMKAAWVAREFDFFPNLRMYYFNTITPEYHRINVIDTDFSDIFEANDLEKIHRASVQTILGVPDSL